MSKEVLREGALKWLKEKEPSHEQIADKIVETADATYLITVSEMQQEFANTIAKGLKEISVINDRKWWEFWK